MKRKNEDDSMAKKEDIGQQALQDGTQAGMEQPDDAATTGGESDVVQRYVDDEDVDEFGSISFKTIMGGDILQSKFFQRQVMFIVFVAVLMLVYTGNRYSSQQDIIFIDSLKVQLQKERYNVLTQSSELLNLSRQSNIEKALIANGDSDIVNPTTPPYEIIADK